MKIGTLGIEHFVMFLTFELFVCLYVVILEANKPRQRPSQPEITIQRSHAQDKNPMIISGVCSHGETFTRILYAETNIYTIVSDCCNVVVTEIRKNNDDDKM